MPRAILNEKVANVAPNWVPNGAESGPGLRTGFRPRFWGRIPAHYMNYIRGAESGPENGSGIRPQKWSRNPARILFLSADFESFFGLAAGSWCAFPGEHMRFGLALVITPAPLLCGNPARSNLVRPGFVGLERFM